jgi:G3E family GTPase
VRYGIGSFVYSSRRPFHPQRLWELVSQPFCVLQPGAEEEEDDDDEEDVEEVDDTEWAADADVEMEGESEDEDGEEAEETPEETLARMKAEKEAMNLPARADFKKKSNVWKGVLRSKGFCWLATRPSVHGEWSQAGVSSRLVCTAVRQLIIRSCLPSVAEVPGCVPCQRPNGRRMIPK